MMMLCLILCSGLLFCRPSFTTAQDTLPGKPAPDLPLPDHPPVYRNVPIDKTPFIQSDSSLPIPQQGIRRAEPDQMPLILTDSTQDPRMPKYPAPDFSSVDRDPVPVKTVQPKYPKKYSSFIGEVTVWVNVLVGVDGKVKRAKVMKSDHPDFSQPSLDAAKLWTFKPAMLNGKPIETWTAIPFWFTSGK